MQSRAKRRSCSEFVGYSFAGPKTIHGQQACGRACKDTRARYFFAAKVCALRWVKENKVAIQMSRNLELLEAVHPGTSAVT
jgi:hypothetical protein